MEYRALVIEYFAFENQDYANIACDFDRWALLVACRAHLEACRALFDGM